MAEAFVHRIAGDRFYPQSAGLEPGRLNPLAVEAINADIDIRKEGTQSVFEFLNVGKRFHYFSSVCDEVSAERYPVFPASPRG